MKSLAFVFALLLIVSACDSSPIGAIGQEKDQKSLDELMLEIETLIADKSCSKSSNCQVIAYGAKACGGPQGYLVYASDNVDIAQLQSLVDKYTAMEVEMNEKYDVISDCALMEAPSPSCLSGNCQ